jgi:hypothetical protein
VLDVLGTRSQQRHIFVGELQQFFASLDFNVRNLHLLQQSPIRLSHAAPSTRTVYL